MPLGLCARRRSVSLTATGAAGLVLAAAMLGAAAPGEAVASAAPASERPRIEILSNRADVVSGGRALAEVKLPAGGDPADLRVRLRAGKRTRDISARFQRRRANGRQMAIVPLRVGRNRLIASLPGSQPARARITNHPDSGPVLSGPQLQPWECQETAVDEHCRQPVSYDFLYRSTEGGELQPYDPNDPPDDVATTTTDQGVAVPFIVRVETGYQNRDQYRIATLFQPGERWRPWAPQEQWNHKLLITHGSSCGVSYRSGSTPSVTSAGGVGIPVIDDLSETAEAPAVAALARGFAVMSTALAHNGHNCNIALQAESLVTAKERVVEEYGPIRYTIGTGCSGGSITQQQVANAYPGLYQGITPQCSYPDSLSTGAHFANNHLLRRYFEDPSKWGPGVVWLPTQWGAVEGHIAHLNAVVSDEAFFKTAAPPTSSCRGISDEQRYHPDANPSGVRCGILDYMINVLGPRPKREWTAAERRRGQGWAGIPLGNVGLQYGFHLLRRGEITPAQFVDLNAKVGGLDIDINPTAERTPGHRRALRNVYRSGAVNRANNLEGVAIIDIGGPDPGFAHDARLAWAMRARLQREQGHHGNHVIWFGHVPILGGLDYPIESMLAIDRWLAAVERDRSDRPLAEKVVDNRPADIEDRCSQLPVLELVAVPGIGKVCELDLVQTRFGTASTVAGDAFTTDRQRCALKPLDRSDYGLVGSLFTDEQWGQLEATFPDGVCDWSRPGPGEGPTIPWLSYQRRSGEGVPGGRRLGPAPPRSGTGWTSPAFRSWRDEG